MTVRDHIRYAGLGDFSRQEHSLRVGLHLLLRAIAGDPQEDGYGMNTGY